MSRHDHEKPLTNDEFLDLWRRNGPTEAILAYEAVLVQARLAAMEQQYEQIIADKQAVAGGDDWHDGQFRATDAAAGNLVDQHADLLRMLELPQVELPEEASTVVSLGSRVSVSQNKAEPYLLDIVGVKRLYPGSQDVEVATLLSPLGRVLIGHKMGEVVASRLIGGRRQSLEIIDSQPLPLDLDKASE